MRSRLMMIVLALGAMMLGAAAFAQFENDRDSAAGDGHDLQNSPVRQTVTVRPTHGYPLRGTLIEFSRDWITLRDAEGGTFWIPRDTVWYIENRPARGGDDAETPPAPAAEISRQTAE